MFFQNILKSKTRDKSVQARKKLFCHVIVKNYLHNVLCKFLIKIKNMWRRKIKEQAPQLILLCCSRTVRSSHRSCSIKKAVFNKFRNNHRKHLCWSLFLKKLQVRRSATLLKRYANSGVFL